jgi:hypothetical protein
MWRTNQVPVSLVMTDKLLDLRDFKNLAGLYCVLAIAKGLT